MLLAALSEKDARPLHLVLVPYRYDQIPLIQHDFRADDGNDIPLADPADRKCPIGSRSKAVIRVVPNNPGLEMRNVQLRISVAAPAADCSRLRSTLNTLRKTKNHRITPRTPNG